VRSTASEAVKLEYKDGVELAASSGLHELIKTRPPILGAADPDV
jgi:hypothetical protein